MPKKFYRKIDKRDRKEMVNFLKNHFRYHTMNNWNRSTSYANNVKVYTLGLDAGISGKILEMIDTDEFYNSINILLDKFGRQYNYTWQAGFN